MKKEPQVITYKGKYLSDQPNLINDCFIDGKITYVDKTNCGNGFTSAFLKDYHLEPKMVNVLILPNKGAVESKFKANNNPRIKFFWGGNKDIIDPQTRIVVSTTDMFKLSVYKDIISKGFTINRMLLDEAHTIIQGSLYRKPLENFISYCKALKYKSIVCVTATPLLGFPCDFKIKPLNQVPIQIHVNNDVQFVINEACDKIRNNEPVIVFTNSFKFIQNLARIPKQKHDLPTKIILGDKLLKRLSENTKISSSVDSYIVSSTGFEGMDINFEQIIDGVTSYRNDAQIYILQDLNSDAETFILPNIYQAIHRSRAGFKKCMYSRIERKKEYPSARRLIDLINAKVWTSKVSEEDVIKYSKLRSLGFNQLEINVIQNCVNIITDDFLGLTTYSEKPEIINLYEEIKHWVEFGFNGEYYKEFLDSRKVTIINEFRKETDVNRSYGLDIAYYAKENAELIIEKGFNKMPFEFKFKRLKIPTRRPITPAGEFSKQLKKYLDYQTCDPNYKPNYKIERVQGLLETSLGGHYTKFNAFIKDVIKEYKAKKQSEAIEPVSKYEINQKQKDARDKIATFEKEVEIRVLRLFAHLMNDTIHFEEQERKADSRYYNLLTECPMFLIQKVCAFLDIRLMELDIKSCNPRIIYAELGKELPANFYGENKENKTKINALFNLLSYTKYVTRQGIAKKKPTEPKFHKVVLKRSLINTCNIDEDVAEFLLDRYHTRAESSLFNRCTFKEKELIDAIRTDLSRFNNVASYRRHDSLIVFNQEVHMDFTDVEFMGVKGWFDAWKVYNDVPIYENKDYLCSDPDDRQEIVFFDQSEEGDCSDVDYNNTENEEFWVTLEECPF